MTEHEELLGVLLAADDAYKPEGAMWPQLATAILAAGYKRTGHQWQRNALSVTLATSARSTDERPAEGQQGAHDD